MGPDVNATNSKPSGTGIGAGMESGHEVASSMLGDSTPTAIHSYEVRAAWGGV